MPIYKMEGKKKGLQRYRVRINYADIYGNSKQTERVVYGLEAAKELERRLNAEMKETSACNMTVQELYEEYISVKKYGIRENTLNCIKGTFNKYILPELKHYHIRKLNVPILNKWKLNIEEKKKSNGEALALNYKRSIYDVFTALLNYAVKMEYIEKNLLAVIGNFKDVNLIKKEMEYYTAEEFLKYIKIAGMSAENSEKETGNIYEWNYYVFFNIAFYTGMRKGEIFALKWSDITNNVIAVKRSIQQINGGDKQTPPKNKSSIRSLQIPGPLKKTLDEHYQRYMKIDGFSDDWRICGGQKCIRKTSLEKRNTRYAELAGIKHIRIHDFRHSHASLLVNSGINIQEVARRLGHTDVNITWNTYSHLYPQEQDKAISILNRIV